MDLETRKKKKNKKKTRRNKKQQGEKKRKAPTPTGVLVGSAGFRFSEWITPSHLTWKV